MISMLYSSIFLCFLCLTSFVASAKVNIVPFGPSIPSFYTVNEVPSDFSKFLSFSNLFSTRPSPKAVVHEFMYSRGFSQQDYVIANSHVSKHTGVSHFYLRQLVKGMQVFNGDININVSPSGKVLSYGDSFCRDNIQASSSFSGRQVAFGSRRRADYSIGPVEALGSLLDLLALNQTAVIEQVNHVSLEGEPFMLLKNVTSAYQDPRAMPGWIQLEDGTLEEVWNIQLDIKDDWFNAHISANSKSVVSLVNWISRAEYTVYPLGINDPSEGSRVKIYNPADKAASPLGWHDRGKGKAFTDTEGNNVIAGHIDDDDNDFIPTHPGIEGGMDLIFDFPLNLKQDPDSYMNASVTNLFYWNNILHDLYYRYGFTEVAGNFQEKNFGKGGKGGDAVVACAQDDAGFDNANFASPPDGQRPRMNMYVWDETEPMRDGDLEGGIITHEYTHGVSTRLTGGAANSGCLSWGESGGMGEGWGDIIATLLRLNSSHTRDSSFGMGNYASGGATIRKYVYTTDLRVNPETYQTMDQPGYWGVHAKGATWAVMLYEVYWSLADHLPFSPKWFPDSDDDIPKFSNTLMLQLILDGMKLQPCRPSFMEARDAIILAESIFTEGKYKCAIWKAFAKRGLGTEAELVGGSPWGGGTRKNSFDVPQECH